MSDKNLNWSPDDRAAGRSLPAAYFYDADVFKAEREKIFLRSWHLVAHESELRAPGDFITDEILDQSVLVTRPKSGELRAFHNVCRHRGNRLIEKRRGNSPAFTCGYHGWTYTCDGALRGGPHLNCLSDFQKSDWGLRPVRAEVFGSFVYINFDPHAVSLKTMAPGADDEMRRYLPDLERLVLIEEVDVPVAANWKVIQENSIEGYHFDYSGPVHKQLVSLIDFSRYELRPRGQWWTYIAPARAGVSEAYGLPLEGAHWQTDGFFNLGLWPNTTLYAFPYSDVVGTFIMKPAGPETSILRFGYYAAEGRPIPEVTKACIKWMNEALGPEDIRLNISNQKGLRSLGFDQGRYLISDSLTNRGEHLVRHFHELCHQALAV